MPFKLKNLLLIFILFVGSSFKGDRSIGERPGYPKPEGKHMLFYVQRTMNINTIIYELNYSANKDLDAINPIKMHWINYVDGAVEEPLNFIQKKYAYGIDIKMIDAEKKSYSFSFVSYKKKTIYLMKSSVDHTYKAYTHINNKMVVLNRIFIQIEGGSFWFPKVKYLEVAGKDVIKNEELMERIMI